MQEIDRNTFNYRFTVELLPSEMLIGLKVVNCEGLCFDQKYRTILGLEIGLIFFKISFVHMLWEKDTNKH